MTLKTLEAKMMHVEATVIEVIWKDKASGTILRMVHNERFTTGLVSTLEEGEIELLDCAIKKWGSCRENLMIKAVESYKGNWWNRE